MNKIDIVIPWVDDTDPKWKAERDKHLNKMEERKSSTDSFFRDWGTLQFVFRGIDEFMPWVNKVHLLTYGHIPEWLNIECDKLNIVNHKDFFLNNDDLPIFNANAIEANLLGIEGLSDKFIYFNDDTLILKKLDESRFFKEDKPLDFLVQGIPRRGWLYRKLRSNDIYVSMQENNYRLLNSQFDKKEIVKQYPELFYAKEYGFINRLKNKFFNLFSDFHWLEVYHFPMPYTKQNIKEVYEMYEEVFKETSKSKFRRHTDVNQYIYRFVNLVKGNFVPYFPNDTFAIPLVSYESYMKARDKMFKSSIFCPNDSAKILSEDYEKTKKQLIEDLTKIMPNKSRFEL